MIFLFTIVTVCLTFASPTIGQTDQSAIYAKIQNDQCTVTSSYILTDPGNCDPPCDFDVQKKFCAELTQSGMNAFSCQPFPDSCKGPAGLDPSATQSTSVVTTDTTSATLTSSQSTLPTTSNTGITQTLLTSAPSTQLPLGATSTATTIPSKTAGSKTGAIEGESPINSKSPNPPKSTKDYIAAEKCCQMAKKGNCDSNKYYMRVACAETCGTIGTDVYRAAKSLPNVRQDCKPQQPISLSRRKFRFT